MIEKNHWVHDYETMQNLFVACFEHYKKDETKVFIIHESQNDFIKFIDFLETNIKNQESHISFNGLSFDSQITEFIIKNKKELILLPADQIVTKIFNKTQKVIQKSNNKEFSEYPEWKLSINQIDVFKINHWDNANKRTSLKWAEYAMDMENIQEMPIHFKTLVYKKSEIDLIVDYCLNDVKATKRIMYLSKPLIEVRTTIKNKYGLKCYNYSNTKLGSELLLKLFCEATGQDPREVRNYRTNRTFIAIKDILFPYITFKSIDFIGFHEMLKGKIINNTKNDFKYSLKFNNSVFEYGAGGIHQCIKAGVYKADNDLIIKDLDVALKWRN